MKKHTFIYKRVCLLFAAVVIGGGLYGAPSAFALDGEETRYIVKYIEETAETANDVPFDVVSEAEMKRLDDAGLLAWYEPDAKMELLDEAVSPYYTADKWDLAMVHADAAYEQGYLGQGVRVGVIDSGIYPHASLADNLLEGYNYVGNEDKTDTVDNRGHGTLVAGLIAGGDENGYIGVAPGAELVPLKVTDGNFVDTSVVCAAIYDGVRDYNCNVLNLSLGTSEECNALKEAIDYAEEHGVVVVSAIGNSGDRTLFYPAAYDSVIGVGALKKNGTVSSISNHNGKISLTAPGESVKTTGKRDGYVTGRGTSFSTPYVSGAAAVLLSMDHTLTPQEVMRVLCETATDKGAEGYDEYYGYGCLNLAGGVAAVTERLAQKRTPCVFLSDSQVQNNTERDILCTYFLAFYDENGRFLGSSQQQFLLGAGQTASVQAPDGTVSGSLQILFDANTLTPITIARRTPGDPEPSIGVDSYLRVP